MVRADRIHIRGRRDRDLRVHPPLLCVVGSAGRRIQRRLGRPETDWPSTGMFEVACTSVVPVVAEVIVTVQLAEVVEAPTTV